MFTVTIIVIVMLVMLFGFGLYIIFSDKKHTPESSPEEPTGDMVTPQAVTVNNSSINIYLDRRPLEEDDMMHLPLMDMSDYMPPMSDFDILNKADSTKDQIRESILNLMSIGISFQDLEGNPITEKDVSKLVDLIHKPKKVDTSKFADVADQKDEQSFNMDGIKEPPINVAESSDEEENQTVNNDKTPQDENSDNGNEKNEDESQGNETDNETSVNESSDKDNDKTVDKGQDENNEESAGADKSHAPRKTSSGRKRNATIEDLKTQIQKFNIRK